MTATCWRSMRQLRVKDESAKERISDILKTKWRLQSLAFGWHKTQYFCHMVVLKSNISLGGWWWNVCIKLRVWWQMMAAAVNAISTWIVIGSQDDDDGDLNSEDDDDVDSCSLCILVCHCILHLFTFDTLRGSLITDAAAVAWCDIEKCFTLHSTVKLSQEKIFINVTNVMAHFHQLKISRSTVKEIRAKTTKRPRLVSHRWTVSRALSTTWSWCWSSHNSNQFTSFIQYNFGTTP